MPSKHLNFARLLHFTPVFFSYVLIFGSPPAIGIQSPSQVDSRVPGVSRRRFPHPFWLTLSCTLPCPMLRGFEVSRVSFFDWVFLRAAVFSGPRDRVLCRHFPSARLSSLVRLVYGWRFVCTSALSLCLLLIILPRTELSRY